MSNSPKDNVSKQELQEFLQRLKEHQQTGQEGDLSFRDIQELLEQSDLLEPLIKEHFAAQERQRQNKKRLSLVVLLLVLTSISGIGGFALQGVTSKGRIEQLEAEIEQLEEGLVSSQQQASIRDNSFSKVNSQVSELKDRLDAAQIKIKEREEKLDELQKQLKELEEKAASQGSEELTNNEITKEESSQTPSDRPHANLKTDKETYTRLEPITVDFSFENVPYSERYRIVLALSGRSSGDYFNAGETGTHTFKPQRPGDYEVRAYVYPGEEWVQVEKIKIKVTSDF